MQEASSESHTALERLRSTPPPAGPAREPAAAPEPEPAPAEDVTPRVVRPRRALAAPGEVSRRELRRHERALRSGRPETAAERRRREERRTDVHHAMDRLRTPGGPAEQRPRPDLSEILDRLGSPDLARFAAPLVGTVERILPTPDRDPERAAQAARRREEAEARRRARLQGGRERAAENARRHAEEHERLAREAAEREAALRDDDARREARRAAEEAAAAQEARRQERLRERRAAGLAAAQERSRLAAEAAERERARERREAEEAAAAVAREAAALQARLEEEARARRERLEQEERRVREQAEEAARLEQAARIARRRRAEERERQRHEAERRRRVAQEERASAAAEAKARRREREERRAHEAAAAQERARVQAERRAREDAELAERERLRLEAEAEAERRRRAEEAQRRRIEAERAEAERRRRAEEAERLRREAEEARRLHRLRARRFTVLHAERALAQARLLEDRAREAERRAEEAAALRLREHQDRESRALYRAARELEGPEVIPAASQRPLLARPEEDLSDEELFARARQALPEWRHRRRLATKAQAVGAEAAASGAASPATGPVPLIPGYTPTPPEEPAGPATAADRRDQGLLTLAWALFVFAGAWGLGLFRFVPGLDALDAGPYPAAGDGRHGPGATVFSLFALHPVIWPALWLLTGLHVVRQWAPGQGAAPRHRRTRRTVAAALLAVALWFPLTVLVPWGLESLAWLSALVLLLGAVRRLGARAAPGRAVRLAEDGALGALLGTLLAASPTALGASLHAWGVHVAWFPTELVAVLLLMGLLLGGARLVLGGRGRIGVALGMAWTLLCLALPRLLPSPLGAQQSAGVGLLAAFGALLLLTVVGVRRSWARQVEHDAARASAPTAG